MLASLRRRHRTFLDFSACGSGKADDELTDEEGLFLSGVSPGVVEEIVDPSVTGFCKTSSQGEDSSNFQICH